MNKNKQELKPTRPVLQPLLTFEQVNLIAAFERMWMQLAHWTRAFMQCCVFDLPDLSAVTEKLYSLPGNFYDILSCYFGNENSQTFVDLLLSFIYSGVKTLEGIRNGDQEQISVNVEQWYDDADRFAVFLSSMSVYWDQGQWDSLFYQDIQRQIEAVTTVMRGDFLRDIELYDSVENLTFLMGNYMGRGILAISQYQYGYQKRS